MLEMPDQHFDRSGKERSFDRKKQEYFVRLGLRVRKALRLHQSSGLWERKEGKRDWGNVSEHCLVEAARADTLADWLGLPSDIRDDLGIAVALHDFSKKQEIEGMREAAKRGIPLPKALYNVEYEGKEAKLRESGFSERVIRFVNASGALPETSLEVKRLLDSDQALSDEDIAFLAMYYTDAYTRDADWVEPASPSGENELDWRVTKNKRYEELEQAVIAARAPDEPLFSGKTLSEAMGEMGHRIEDRFSRLIEKKTGKKIDPIQFPETIDKEIRNKIDAAF